jgi:hypothetical protein
MTKESLSCWGGVLSGGLLGDFFSNVLGVTEGEEGRDREGIPWLAVEAGEAGAEGVEGVAGPAFISGPDGAPSRVLCWKQANSIVDV